MRKINHSAKGSSEDNDLTIPNPPDVVEGPGTEFPKHEFVLTQPENPPDKPSPGRNRVIWRWLGRGSVLLVLILMVGAVYQNRQDLGQALSAANWGWLSLALALNLLGSLFYIAVWEMCSRQLKASGKLAGTLIALSMAGAARYLPGGIWPIAGLVYFAPEIGLPRRQVPLLALFAQLAHLVAAGLAGIISFSLLLVAVASPEAGSATFWLGVLLGLSLGVGVLTGLPRYLAPLFPGQSSLLGGLKLSQAALFSIIFWVVNGLRLWVMVLAFGPQPGVEGLAFLLYVICTGAITTILAALFFFVPLGLGVVELSLGWWLAQVIPWHLALAVVALNRLLRILNDFLYFGLSLMLVRSRRRH